MKIEVGKTYLNRMGDKVRVVGRNTSQSYPFRDAEGETYTRDGGYFFELAESVKDLVSEAPDLTQITTPFGLLDEETQKALKAHEGLIEYYHSSGIWMVTAGAPSWLRKETYRAKPEPKRETLPVTVHYKGESFTVWVTDEDGKPVSVSLGEPK